MSQPQVPPPVPVARKRKSRKKLWITLSIVLLLALILGVVIKAKGSAPKDTLVTVEKAQIKTITQVVTATGKVQPETEVRISSEAAGELIEIPVVEGQEVHKGDVLARIKADYYQAQLDQQEAALTSSESSAVLSKAQLMKAENDLKQADLLWEKQLVSESEYLATKTTYEVAKASYDSALAQIRRTQGMLNQAKDQISKTTVFSPMDGTISSLTSKVGDMFG